MPTPGGGGRQKEVAGTPFLPEQKWDSISAILTRVCIPELTIDSITSYAL